MSKNILLGFIKVLLKHNCMVYKGGDRVLLSHHNFPDYKKIFDYLESNKGVKKEKEGLYTFI
jgi:hypothetical protein